MKSTNPEDYNYNAGKIGYRKLNSLIDSSRTTFSLDSLADDADMAAERQDGINPFEVWLMSGIDRGRNKNDN